MVDQSTEYDIQAELERINASIENYAVQLDAINGAIQTIEEENQNDDVSRQIVEYQTKWESNPASIPAEDALDTITRLENTLRIVKRRNHLLTRENTTQERLLQDRSKLLLRETKVFDEILSKTGWYEQYSADFEEQAQKADDIREMTRLEATVQRELRAAQSIIKKKEAVVRDLERQVETGGEVEALLNNVYNDIRVKERDSREVEMKLARMRKDNERNDKALTLFETQKQNASLTYMENDREFLKEAVVQMKGVCRRQDNVIKAQITRQQQLHARLDTIMKSLREMKLEKEYERNVSKSALVPSASREEPEDVSKILPEGENVPIHTYRLIHKNNEMMNTNVARKNMLVLEKEGVIQAMEASLLKYANALNMTSKQQEDLKLNKDLEMDELMKELQDQHKNYLSQLEQIMQENNQLKKKLYRVAPSRASIRNH
ncbi:hypothetical protein DQ04_01051070 [Trypanosoma grayi]|uniref:hypothetical protein n=1 Tax=Trypanosoma grayi TaxID=71804 RepID=UPI0004F45EA9|nr:hypothetical protein DQ04_01051070 [Trypanosoma grayi]KEG13354.1 hypothetical protein DQ04_01051070 [Trypanosoma grayi]